MPHRPPHRAATAPFLALVLAAGCSSERFTHVEFVTPTPTDYGADGGGGGGGAGDTGGDSGRSAWVVGSGSAARVRADWNDIDAAVSAALWKHEAAVLTRRATNDAIHFDLATIRDQHGVLTFTRLGDHEAPAPPNGTSPSPDQPHNPPPDQPHDPPHDQPHDPPHDTWEDTRIEIRCAIGLGDHTERERAIIRSVTHRLAQLRSVDTAPVE